MLGSQPSVSTSSCRFSNQYLSIWNRLQNHALSTRPLSNVPIGASASSTTSNLHSLLLSSLRNSLEATSNSPITTSATTTVAPITATSTTATTNLTTFLSDPGRSVQSSFPFSSQDAIPYLAASLMSDFRTHQSAGLLGSENINHATTGGNGSGTSPYDSINNFLPNLYRNTPVRYTMEDVNSFLLAKQESNVSAVETTDLRQSRGHSDDGDDENENGVILLDDDERDVEKDT